MSAGGELLDGRPARVARFALATSLVVLAAVKFPLLFDPHVVHGDGVAGALRSRPAVGIAALTEATLGSLLLTRHSAWAVRMVGCWLAVLTGVLAALLILGEAATSCGCLSGREPGVGTRIAVLVGVAATTFVASRDGVVTRSGFPVAEDTTQPS